MNIRRCRAALVAWGSMLGMAGILCAQDVPGSEPQSVDGTHAKGKSEGRGAREIIPHRANPHQAGAPTAGSTGQITPVITWHGGPVMPNVVVYLIWYGNWNQSNGSDTPSGQQIVRDFLNGLSGSGYYMTNSTYKWSEWHFHRWAGIHRHWLAGQTAFGLEGSGYGYECNQWTPSERPYGYLL